MTKSKPSSYFEQIFAKTNAAATLRFSPFLFDASHLSQGAAAEAKERANEGESRDARPEMQRQSLEVQSCEGKK